MSDVRVLHGGGWADHGGAALVAREIALALDAEITVGHTGNPEFWEKEGLDPDYIFQDHFRRGVSGFIYENFIPRDSGYLGPRMSQKFKSVDFDEDIIFSAANCARWIVPKPGQKHINYCHNVPPRFYEHTRDSLFGWATQTGLSIVDQHFNQFIDRMVANSQYTANRAAKYYDREIDVINPPVRFDRFWNAEPEDYFVTIGRFAPEKWLPRVVSAFQDRDVRIVAVGSGPLEDDLRQMGADVRVSPSDEEVEELIAHSIGGVAFGKRETCGITPKEFQAAGKPVIVPDRPNLHNHVEDGVDGVIVEPTESGVSKGIDRVLNTDWDTGRIQETAQGWGYDEFHRQIRELVDEVERDMD